ncbi:MAG: threonylcarbamoyl-AMP synthase [Clostridiaceae bacterium]|nr:threonylcarbamoyl-AMP synthase [Clostridiaceae bacterium]
MKTEIFKVDPENIDEDIMKYCGEKIREGKLVCFPTETVYGLGANALDEKAVEGIFLAKGRPQDNPLIVHIAEYGMLDGIVKTVQREEILLKRLSDRFWPGPLTLIVSKEKTVSDVVTCGLDTVGVRYPSNSITQSLIKHARVPIAAPSANISGKPSPTKASHVIQDLTGKVDIILDGGPCQVGLESTVLDIVSWPPIILRPGAVTQEDISEVVMEVSEHEWQKEVDKPRSPGMKYKHYAPNAKITIYKGEENKVASRINEELKNANNLGLNAFVLASEETLCYYNKEKALSLGSRHNPLEQASRLYDCLRKFDEMGADVVFAEAIENKGVGDAIMNRLFRAASGRLVNI